MRRNKVVLDRETYDNLCELRDQKYDYYIKRSDEYQDRYCKEVDANKKLQNENGYLKALFDKEGDTRVIKYNGKLYRIASMHHFVNDEGVDELDIETVCVGEVG